MQFFKRLNRKSSSSEIRKILLEAEGARDAAEDAAGKLEAKLGDVVVYGNDADKVKLKQDITAEKEKVKDLETGIAALQSSLGAAEAREVTEDTDRKLTAAQAAVKRGAALIRKYEKSANEIAGILVELSAIDQVVLAANAAAAAAGDDRRVETPNELFRKVRDEIIPEHTKTLVVDLKAAERGGLTFKDGIPPKPRLVNIPEKVVKGASRPALQADVVLPSAGSSGENIWPAHDHAARMAIKDQVCKRAGELAA